jgi:hypothetical protein
MQSHSTPNLPSIGEWAEFPDSDFIISPLAYLTEVLLASEEH